MNQVQNGPDADPKNEKQVLWRRGLALLPETLHAVMPLKRNHRTDLPDAVRELSQLLTTERAELARPYWSSPRFVSAYLRYFLPWNLVRLRRLLDGMTLPEPRIDAKGKGPLVVDLGSGPLSFPLALWLCSEKWRKTPVRLVCVDTAPRPMELGRALFEDLANRLGEPLLWSIRLERSSLVQGLRGLGEKPLLITAGNVLNEWQGQQKGADNPLSERLGDVAEAITRSLAPGGQAIMVEPGTRLGGTLTATLREEALTVGLHPLAPCPHEQPCPLIGRRDRGWCHIHYEDEPDAPEWLLGLAKTALLTKHGLSLSYLQLATAPAETPPKGLMARIISQTLAVPGMGLSRYGCAECGLTLVARARFLVPGSLAEVYPSTEYDAKSGALKVSPEPGGRVTPFESAPLPQRDAPMPVEERERPKTSRDEKRPAKDGARFSQGNPRAQKEGSYFTRDSQRSSRPSQNKSPQQQRARKPM